jgi:hypothetical protein
MMSAPKLISRTVEYAEQLLERRDLAAAEAAFQIASYEGIDPNRCAAGLWLTYMLQGNFAAAWKQSDAILSRGEPDISCFWHGQPIDGKRIIVRCLHGFGDAVHMFRYLPMLVDRCDRVIVEVPPRLLEIAPYFRAMTDVITWGADAPSESPVWDVQVEVTELPHLFRTEVTDLPITTKYLELPLAVKSAAADLMRSGKRRVGIVWSTGEWNRTRAIPFEQVKTLTHDEDFEFWNLQGDAEHDQWDLLPPSYHLRDGREAGDGILKLAALIEQMDLVITPDTLAAHLAGALGTPAWVLLQHSADWRWMHERSSSPWYPSLRLFRQTKQGDWDTVTAQVLDALVHWKRNA